MSSLPKPFTGIAPYSMTTEVRLTGTGAANRFRKRNDVNEIDAAPVAVPVINTVAGNFRRYRQRRQTERRCHLGRRQHPTGTITFYAFAPGVTPLADYSNNVYSNVVTIGGNSGSVTGNGTYNTATMGNHPGGFLPNFAGTYLWTAVYSGDNANLPAYDNGQNESELSKRPRPRSAPAPA